MHAPGGVNRDAVDRPPNRSLGSRAGRRGRGIGGSTGRCQTWFIRTRPFLQPIF